MNDKPGHVKVLPDSLISKIAAGEVVQRPASVVKELVENSIDSGASKVTVVIKNAGKSMIQVTDDGSGMDEEDLLLAVERHATSKISTLEELGTVTSLGFRGEALPSISAVSRFEITSTPEGADRGSKMRIEGGIIRSVTPAPAAPGTNVTVRNLFYNTPARRKFLKSTQVEYRHILAAVKRFALSVEGVVFELYSNDNLVFAAREKRLLDRIGETFKGSYVKSVKPVSGQNRTVKVDGYVGGIDLIRRSRGEQYLSVNHRFFQDRKMSSAVFSAYGNLVSRGEFPFFVLSVTLDPRMVDVNVHPSKMEVKFQNEWEVYETLKSAVHEAVHPLKAFVGSRPPGEQPSSESVPMPPGRDRVIEFRPAMQDRSRHDQFRSEGHSTEPIRADEITEKDEGFARAKDTYHAAFPDDESEPELVEGHVWQIHRKYLVSQVSSGIVVIDQHVAHERILYEQALKAIEAGKGMSQQLLFPQTIEFSPEDHSILLEILAFLNSIGFEIHEFGERTVVLQAVPADIRAGAEGRVLREILDNYRETTGKEVPAHKTLAASYACKAAVKAGEKLTDEEMRSLVDRLFATEYPYFCPHGRPVIVQLTLDELDKRFERK